MYDPVFDDEELTSSAMKRLSLKKVNTKGLKLKPSAWVSATKPGDRSVYSSRPPEGSTPNEVSLIDFGEDMSSSAPSPVMATSPHHPCLARLNQGGENILDGTSHQSPSRVLPRPLHPTLVVDWDSRPLPPPPAYDDVAQDEDDIEVSSINSAEIRTHPDPDSSSESRTPGVSEDNLFFPSMQSHTRTFSQSAEIFQELQQECMRHLNVPVGSPILPSPSEDKPRVPPRVPIPPRPLKNPGGESVRHSRDLSPASGGEDEKRRPPQIPPRDPLSQPCSRTPSPMNRYLSTSPGKFMPTTQSFASDPKYAAPKVIQAQGRDRDTPKVPCILPIVRDGKKISSTHYYLLPERPTYLDRYDKFFREAEEEEKRTINTATVRPMMKQHVETAFCDGNGSLTGTAGRASFRNSQNLNRISMDGTGIRTDAAFNADRVKLVSK